MDEAKCGKDDMSDTHVVSLATETALNNSGLVFSDGSNMLASAGDHNSTFKIFIHMVLCCDAGNKIMNSEVRKRFTLEQRQRTYLTKINLVTEHLITVELREEQQFKVVSGCICSIDLSLTVYRRPVIVFQMWHWMMLVQCM
jgi:hypothetical protein